MALLKASFRYGENFAMVAIRRKHMQQFDIQTGNELIIQGGREAGFQLYTGYPGSPLADFFNILYAEKDELKKEGIQVVIANSEANAAAMASGAKMAGKDVLVGMKSMGLHVASDALSVGNFANPIKPDEKGEYPGVVVVVGDDPWSISTSTPADSRYLYKHLHIPFLEPGTPDELKNWMGKALEISRKSSVYCGVLLTTYMAEGGGRVELNEMKKVDASLVNLNPAEFDLSKNVMVPPNSLFADKAMIEERFPRVFDIIESLKLDQHTKNDSKMGIVSAGATYEVLKQVLEESKLIDQFQLYKVGCSYPLIENNLKDFLNSIDHLLVVEEKRGFLENELKNLIQEKKYNVKVDGKKFHFNSEAIEGFPAFGGLEFENIYTKLNQYLDCLDFKEKDNCQVNSGAKFKLDIELAKRLPTFCPGCPHRETLSLLKELRKTLDKEKNIDLISHGDVGCYSLSFLEPFKEMHDLSAMGQGGALGAGADLFTKNPSVVLMGDSTFFHSGMSAISNSVQLGHNITYILLDNDNTAMTGHQMSPSSGLSVDGVTRPRQSMIEIAQSMKVDVAMEVNPSDRYFYKNLLNDLILKPGVKVIISNKECGLTFHGRKKKYERSLLKNSTLEKKQFYQINTLACEDCRACVELTGCPGLSQTQDAYGTKVDIDPQICVSDSYCTKIKACPSFELVEVTDFHPSKYRETLGSEAIELPLPETKINFEAISNGQNFNVVVIGVGGTGVTTISKVIASAAKKMQGRDDILFKFVDQKGLAQRNGSVTSHLSFYSKKKSHAQTTPLGGADIVLSPDLLEGARAIQYLGEDGTLIVDNNFQIPLSILLDRAIEKDPLNEQEIRTELEQKLSDQLLLVPFKDKSYNTFSKSVYASAMLLGAAFQKGLFPFSLESLKEAIKESVPRAEIDNNLIAFDMGRKYIIEPFEVGSKTLSFTSRDFEISLAQSHLISGKSAVAKFKNAQKELIQILPDFNEEHMNRYLHDMIVYDGGQGISSFFENVRILKTKYSDKLLKKAVALMAKTFFVKDEVFVAHALNNHLKHKRDKFQYGKVSSGYKVTHINRPEFVLFGKKIEFDIHTQDWMLSLMMHCRFLRKLMPSWHMKERSISQQMRTEVLSGVEEKRLRELDQIKGYRQIRYDAAKKVGISL